MKTIHQEMPKIIAWAMDAAREHVELAHHFGETPDSKPTMGLRQSFDYNFPLASFPASDRDLALNLGMDTYKQAVKTFSNWQPR
jgi:hypothetical protein